MNSRISHNPETAGEVVRETGGEISDMGRSAYSLSMPTTSPLPIVLAVPHAGRSYPQSVLRDMRDPDFSRIRLEDRYVDRIGSAVAKDTGTVLILADAPRAMIDLNRSPEDVDWGMIANRPSVEPNRTQRHSSVNRRARGGLGLIPRKLPGHGEIWNGSVPWQELDRRIQKIHRPYHAALAKVLAMTADKWGGALLIDLHSMPPLQPDQQSAEPARFVIGDRYGSSADHGLVAAALRHFANARQNVAHNRPYSGGYILDRHSAPGRNIHAIQLEICRSLYLGPDMRDTTDGLDFVVGLVIGLVRDLGQNMASLASRNGQSIAAE